MLGLRLAQIENLTKETDGFWGSHKNEEVIPQDSPLRAWHLIAVHGHFLKEWPSTFDFRTQRLANQLVVAGEFLDRSPSIEL